jgi:hypothetical protein
MAEPAHVITQPQRLATTSAEAAEEEGSANALAVQYSRLRADALAVNARHGWATPEQFGAQFPTLDGVSVIEALDRAVEQGSRPADRVAPTSDRLVQLLRDLAGWATGVRTAYETLEDMNRD